MRKRRRDKVNGKWHVRGKELWRSVIISGWCDENTRAGKSAESCPDWRGPVGEVAVEVLEVVFCI